MQRPLHSSHAEPNPAGTRSFSKLPTASNSACSNFIAPAERLVDLSCWRGSSTLDVNASNATTLAATLSGSIATVVNVRRYSGIFAKETVEHRRENCLTIFVL